MCKRGQKHSGADAYNSFFQDKSREEEMRLAAFFLVKKTKKEMRLTEDDTYNSFFRIFLHLIMSIDYTHRKTEDGESNKIFVANHSSILQKAEGYDHTFVSPFLSIPSQSVFIFLLTS